MEATATDRFGEMVKSDVPLLVDMFATWCGPCKILEPAVKQVAGNLSGKVRVIKIDIDKNPHVARAYQVQGVPTLILFHKGQIKWRTSGVIPAHQIEKEVLGALR